MGEVPLNGMRANPKELGARNLDSPLRQLPRPHRLPQRRRSPRRNQANTAIPYGRWGAPDPLGHRHDVWALATDQPATSTRPLLSTRHRAAPQPRRDPLLFAAVLRRAAKSATTRRRRLRLAPMGHAVYWPRLDEAL